MPKDRRLRIGQLFCAPLRWDDFQGDEGAIRAYLDRIIDLDLAGLILFGGDLDATPRLLKGLQRRVNVPLLVMADVETGTAQQIPGGTEFPGMMALGATRSHTLSRRVGKATARESIDLGINVVLAPVLDVNTNPLNPIIGTRSFGEDPHLVADLGAAYIGGCMEVGAMATAKHFPGHGDTSVDSHIALPVVRRGPGSLREIELPPFEQAISTGVPAVMVGHIALPEVTGSDSSPASRSREIVTGLLRGTLGFEGLVMTDAMIMGGAAESAAGGKPVVQALRAGVDLLLYVDDEARGIETVETALDEGELDEAVVDLAIRRVSDARHSMVTPAGDREAAVSVGCREHGELAREVGDSAATLVRNQGGFFPISTGEGGLFVVCAEDKIRREMILPDRLRTAFPDWPLIAIDPADPFSGDVGARVEEASKVVLFIFTVVRAGRGVADLPEEGLGIVAGIIGRSKRAGIVSLGSPYLMRHFPGIEGYLCLYGPSGPSQEAAVRVLHGDLSPAGRLPVSIPGLYPSGWGIPLERSECDL